MIQPGEPGIRPLSSVRDGQLVAVTCAICGCRLAADERGGTIQWRHFGALGGRDAIGCRVACIEAAHDRTGRPISP